MLKIPNMVLIGGNSRNSGKTSMVCSIIAQLSAKHDVIGLKVTRIRPDEGEFHGNHNENISSGFSVYSEENFQSHKDTSQMLRAGAKQVFYIRTADSFAEQAIIQFLSSYTNNQVIVCESRSLRNIIEPGLFLMMIRNPSISKPKDIASYIGKADFVLDFKNQNAEVQHIVNSLSFINGQFIYVGQKQESLNF